MSGNLWKIGGVQRGKFTLVWWLNEEAVNTLIGLR